MSNIKWLDGPPEMITREKAEAEKAAARVAGIVAELKTQPGRWAQISTNFRELQELRRPLGEAGVQILFEAVKLEVLLYARWPE
jgi:hypothetical protein